MSLRGRRSRLIVVIGLVLAGVLAAALVMRTSMLRAAGRALVVDEAVDSVDAIVVPQWAGAAGVVDAADLVRAGIARRVMLLPEPSRPVEQELARRGVPYVNGSASLVRLFSDLGVTCVEVIPEPAAGTEAEGRVLLDWCDERRLRSIVVVSSPDHSRRLRRVLHRELRNSSTKVIVRSARYAPFNPDDWWKTRDGQRTEIVELEKLVLDVVRHPI